MARVTRTITANSQFTDPVKLSGYFNVSISGTWTGTITVQRSWDLGDTWLDVDNWTANTEEYGLEPEYHNAVLYRIGAKADALTSGSVALRLSQ